MRTFYLLEDVPDMNNLVLTQGTFDGVHAGHQKVLKQVVQRAQELNGESMLLTFYPHPRLVLQPNDKSLKLLTTIEEKCRLVEESGIQNVLILPFTTEVSRLTPLDFVRSVLVDKLKVKTVIVGYDHRFGKNREGSFNDLLEFGEMFNFSVEEIPAREIDDIAISSTRIRNALNNGELTLANELLARPFSLEGKVVHGKSRGKVMGFPTANIELTEPHKLIPKDGVYAVKIQIGVEKFNGAANIGYNPTFDDKTHSIEVFIFDFDREIYDIAVRLELIGYLRPEQKFNSVEELKEKIKQDVHAAKAVLSAY